MLINILRFGMVIVVVLLITLQVIVIFERLGYRDIFYSMAKKTIKRKKNHKNIHYDGRYGNGYQPLCSDLDDEE